MKTEQENCTVTVRGIQRVEGDEDVVELVTGGRFTCHGGRWLIRYEESDDTGYGGCHTSLRYDPQKGQVVLLRTGEVHSQLIVEEGKRHQCTYDTGCGTVILGVNGSRIEAELDDGTVVAGERGMLDAETSAEVFARTGRVRALRVTVGPRA